MGQTGQNQFLIVIRNDTEILPFLWRGIWESIEQISWLHWRHHGSLLERVVEVTDPIDGLIACLAKFFDVHRSYTELLLNLRAFCKWGSLVRAWSCVRTILTQLVTIVEYQMI